MRHLVPLSLLSFLLAGLGACAPAALTQPPPVPVEPPPRPSPLAVVAPPAVNVPRGGTCDFPGFREEVLRRVNEVRTAGQRCGNEWQAPVPPLAWSAPLFSAAAGHSQAMAEGNFMEHVDPAGRRPGARVTATGYRWRTVGENIAGGDGNVEQVIAGWLRSKEHCRNIMAAEFRDIGMACTEQPGSQWHTYWTMVLAASRR